MDSWQRLTQVSWTFCLLKLQLGILQPWQNCRLFTIHESSCTPIWAKGPPLEPNKQRRMCITWVRNSTMAKPQFRWVQKSHIDTYSKIVEIVLCWTYHYHSLSFVLTQSHSSSFMIYDTKSCRYTYPQLWQPLVTIDTSTHWHTDAEVPNPQTGDDWPFLKLVAGKWRRTLLLLWHLISLLRTISSFHYQPLATSPVLTKWRHRSLGGSWLPVINQGWLETQWSRCSVLIMVPKINHPQQGPNMNMNRWYKSSPRWYILGKKHTSMLRSHRKTGDFLVGKEWDQTNCLVFFLNLESSVGARHRVPTKFPKPGVPFAQAPMVLLSQTQ